MTYQEFLDKLKSQVSYSQFPDSRIEIDSDYVNPDGEKVMWSAKPVGQKILIFPYVVRAGVVCRLPGLDVEELTYEEVLYRFSDEAVEIEVSNVDRYVAIQNDIVESGRDTYSKISDRMVKKIRETLDRGEQADIERICRLAINSAIAEMEQVGDADLEHQRKCIAEMGKIADQMSTEEFRLAFVESINGALGLTLMNQIRQFFRDEK